MGLTFRPEFRAKLFETLRAILARVVVSNNQSLQSLPFYELKGLEDELRKKTELWQKCELFVSDEPFRDYFFEVIDAELRASREYKLDTPDFQLTSLAEYQDIDSSTEKLIGGFEALPMEYRLFFKTSFSLADHFEFFKKDARYELSESFGIVSIGDNHSDLFPETSVPNPRISFSLFGRRSPSEITLYWNENRTYFEISVKGFIGLWTETNPLRNAQFSIRSFFGLAYALGILKKGFSINLGESYLLVYKKEQSKWITQKARQLPFETGRSMDSFHVATIDGNKLFGSEEKQWLRRLDLIKNVFKDGEENEVLIRASQWLFDSFVGDDELLSFVKATVCLEILLGDKATSDLIGLGELLRNRCAYLISSNKKERELILKDFNEIYRTRSKIVHSGKNRLSSQERESLYKLRNLCQRVLSHEIYLR